MIDAHLHLDRFEDPEAAWEQMRRMGVNQALVPGVQEPFLPAPVTRAKGLDFGLGLHPQFPAQDRWQERLEAAVDRYGPVAIGELGWDRRGGSELQIALDQLDLATARQLPVIIHLVGSQPQLLKAINARRLRAMLHRSAGKPSRYRDWWLSGHFISIGPQLRGDLRLAQEVPKDQFLLETDAESEAEEPWRRLPELYREVAAARGLELEALKALMRANYKRFRGE